MRYEDSIRELATTFANSVLKALNENALARLSHGLTKPKLAKTQQLFKGMVTVSYSKPTKVDMSKFRKPLTREEIMEKHKLTDNQSDIYKHLTAKTGQQLTNDEIASATGITKNITKHALKRLLKLGLVMRTDDRPQRWQATPQTVDAPPQGSAGSIHNSLPTA